jgi:hypothetical protein
MPRMFDYFGWVHGLLFYCGIKHGLERLQFRYCTNVADKESIDQEKIVILYVYFVVKSYFVTS